MLFSSVGFFGCCFFSLLSPIALYHPAVLLDFPLSFGVSLILKISNSKCTNDDNYKKACWCLWTNFCITCKAKECLIQTQIFAIYLLLSFTPPPPTCPHPPCSLQLWLVIVFKRDIYNIYRLIMLSELFQRVIYDCNRLMLESLVCVDDFMTCVKVVLFAAGWITFQHTLL